MRREKSIWLTAALLILTGPPAALAQDTLSFPLPVPTQVNDSAVARGRELFHGTANCAACHGPAGAGTDSGPALQQGVWMHGPDTFEGILARVIHGVPKAYSTRGLAMPMRGWVTLTDAEARDVAAYVWTISHAWRRPERRRPS